MVIRTLKEEDKINVQENRDKKYKIISNNQNGIWNSSVSK